MEKKIEFCGNAVVIHSLNDLPKIGETKMYLGNRMTCISVAIERFDLDCNTDDDYIVYVAKYCETDSLAMLDEFEMDCSRWLFAIKRSNLIESK